MKSIFERVDPERLQEVPEGSVLLREGTTSGKLYVLAAGALEILRGDTRVAVVTEPGAFFGEMSVLLDAPHTASVRALVPSRVYAFEDARTFLRSDPDIALVLARMLAQRLNAATTYLVDLKRQYGGGANHLGMVSEVLASLIHNQEPEFTPGSDRQPDPAL